jgi:hypothetical protein
MLMRLIHRLSKADRTGRSNFATPLFSVAPGLPVSGAESESDQDLPGFLFPLSEAWREPVTLRACTARSAFLSAGVERSHPSAIQFRWKTRRWKLNEHDTTQALPESRHLMGHVQGPEVQTVHDASVRVGSPKLPPADTRGPGAPTRPRGSCGVHMCAARAWTATPFRRFHVFAFASTITLFLVSPAQLIPLVTHHHREQKRNSKQKRNSEVSGEQVKPPAAATGPRAGGKRSRRGGPFAGGAARI